MESGGGFQKNRIKWTKLIYCKICKICVARVSFMPDSISATGHTDFHEPTVNVLSRTTINSVLRPWKCNFSSRFGLTSWQEGPFLGAVIPCTLYVSGPAIGLEILPRLPICSKLESND
jgi:hypothetical protein